MRIDYSCGEVDKLGGFICFYLHPQHTPVNAVITVADSTYRQYYKSMRTLKEKMGDAEFATLLALLKKANDALLEEKEHG